MTDNSGMKATSLTKLLIGIILLIAVLTITANWYLQDRLSSEIQTTNSMKYEASMSDSNLSKAKALQTYMTSHADDVKRASEVVAESQTYTYQNQIITDLTSYASATGVAILEFSFPDKSASGQKKASGTLKSVSVEITLQKPLGYTNFISFLKYIEQNRTKMQITDISIATNKDNPRLIDSPTVGLEVYVK